MAEVKQRMGYAEGLQWLDYRRRHGGIGTSHGAYLLACIATMTNNANGGKAELHDFLPSVPAKSIDSADQFMQYFGIE